MWSGGSGLQKLLATLCRFNWALAFVIAAVAAVVFRYGYEEVAAVIWLISLILVLPMWSNPRL
jgi:hypothetical protein